jgi:hypothetical protein
MPERLTMAELLVALAESTHEEVPDVSADLEPDGD